jgi:polar amino acid transport system substrate-binding protein
MHSLARRALIGWLGLAAALCAAAARAEELKAVTGSWCPFECSPEDADGLRGYLNDMAEAIFAEHGITIRFVSTSYLRGIEMVREGQGQILIGIAQEDAPGLVYPAVDQGRTGHTFFVRAGDPWRYTGVASFEQLTKVGTMQGYDYGELNESMARNPQRIEVLPGTDRARRNLQKLLARRVDAIIADDAVVEFQARRLGRAHDITRAGTLGVGQRVYIAFSPKLPDAARYAELLSRGTQKLRASGALAKILEPYGLRDWEKSRP